MHHTGTPRQLLAQLPALLKLMRPRQWVKNSFVLAPLIFAGQFLEASAIGLALLATVIFCLASSATYIVNDIRDIEQDRRHPEKSISRPLASGATTLSAASKLLVCLYLLVLLSLVLLPVLALPILCYLLLNLAYTLVLKHQPVLDIFTIAIGFVLRVYAGAAVLNVPLSSWMFITTLCLALYLASVKRRQELSSHGTNSRKVLENYSLSLINRYAEMSATGALLFYSMFVVTTKPELVITVPLVLYGLFRYWYIVEKIDGGESPTDALLSDRQLLSTVLLWAGICSWALWPA